MRSLIVCALFLLLTALPAAAGLVLNQEDISWTTEGGLVRFQMHFYNPGPTISEPATGQLHAQPYGAFVDNVSPIGTFNIPPFNPDSFFDVFFDVPLADLPPSAGEITPWNKAASDLPCPPDFHWDGNVDVIWYDANGGGSSQAHYGTLQVCPGFGGSMIHVLTNCPGAAAWAITGLCPGFTAVLVNEDLTPASNPLPAGWWTGYIVVTADAATPLGTTCCFSVDFNCGGVVVPVNLCATACECGVVGAEVQSWGSIKVLFK